MQVIRKGKIEMSDDLNQNKPESAQQESGFKAFWNKPLKMSEKEIAKLQKKGKEIKQKTVGSEIIIGHYVSYCGCPASGSPT